MYHIRKTGRVTQTECGWHGADAFDDPELSTCADCLRCVFPTMTDEAIKAHVVEMALRTAGMTRSQILDMLDRERAKAAAVYAHKTALAHGDKE